MPTTKKKQNFFSKINFKSPKTRGFIILLAFAIIGAGVMVFRSFAATNVVQSWTYVPTSGPYALISGGAHPPCTSLQVTDADANKNTSPAINLMCPAGYSTNEPSASGARITGSSIGQDNKGNPFRICAWVKGSGSIFIYFFVSSTDGRFNTLKTSNTPSPIEVNDTYGYYCSPVMSDAPAGYVNGSVDIKKGSALVNVKSIVLEQLAPAVGPVTTSSPNPTK